ncbi:hypothetical protein KC323_g91 [Hortaea werneckii]|nr:hypothetical protein KC323_g91 [Hortaea werneckii]
MQLGNRSAVKLTRVRAVLAMLITSIRPKTVPYGVKDAFLIVLILKIYLQQFNKESRHQKVGKLKVGTPHSVDSLLAPLRQEDGKDVEAPDLVKRQIVRFGPDILAATER